jgi:hypothetical protein
MIHIWYIQEFRSIGTITPPRHIPCLVCPGVHFAMLLHKFVFLVIIRLITVRGLHFFILLMICIFRCTFENKYRYPMFSVRCVFSIIKLWRGDRKHTGWIKSIPHHKARRMFFIIYPCFSFTLFLGWRGGETHCVITKTKTKFHECYQVKYALTIISFNCNYKVL